MNISSVVSGIIIAICLFLLCWFTWTIAQKNSVQTIQNVHTIKFHDTLWTLNPCKLSKDILVDTSKTKRR